MRLLNLVVGVEQRLAAPGAMIDARIVILVERAGAGALGAVLAQYPVLRGGQALAPFLVAELDLELRCAAFPR